MKLLDFSIKDKKNEIQWVDISGSEYSIEKLDMIKWLRLYGEVLSPLTEKQHPDSTEDCPIGNGTYIVTMKLRKDMPNFVPMYGRKVKFEHTGPGLRNNAVHALGLTSRNTANMNG